MTDESTDPTLSEAKRAAERDHLIDRLIERVVDRFGGQTGARTVYGDPIEHGDVTVIPVSRVRWLAGAGAGSGGDGTGPGGGEGAGVGGAVVGDPVGYIEVRADGARFMPVRGVPNPLAILALGVAISLVLRALARLLGR